MLYKSIIRSCSVAGIVRFSEYSESCFLYPLKAAHSKNSRRLFFKDLCYQTEWVWPIRNDPPATTVVGVAVVFQVLYYEEGANMHNALF